MHIQGYITLATFLFVIINILYLPILFILKKKGRTITRQLSYLSLFWSIIFVVFVTIILFNIPFDFNQERHSLNIIPLIWLVEGNIKQRIMSEIIPNIMILIPLGIFVPIIFKKTRKVYITILVVFILTLSIEIFQYFIGRSSDIDDLIANLLGGIIGYGIFKVSNYLFENKKWWNKFIGKN